MSKGYGWMMRWLGAVVALVPMSLAAATYQEGRDYERIVPEQPTDAGNKIEVVEIFWYGCPHCHRFQTYVDRWLKNKPADVEWRRLPGILRDEWALHARAFYAAEALGAIDKIHGPLFNAIHAEKRRLDTEEALADFVAAQGVKKDDFRKAFNSFAVDAKVRRARDMGNRYRINSTPSVVVNGKYRLNPSMTNGNYAAMMKVIEHLIEQERRRKS